METFVSSLWAGLKCKIVNVNNVVFMQFLNSLVSSPVWHFANIAYHSSYRIVLFGAVIVVYLLADLKMWVTMKIKFKMFYATFFFNSTSRSIVCGWITILVRKSIDLKKLKKF